MKVLFDAYWWHDGPPSGKMVVREIIREWSTRFPHDELIALVREGQPTDEMPDGVHLVCTRLRPHALATMKLKKIAKDYSVDGIISQNFAVNGRNSGVFVHDVLFQSNPEYFTSLERAYFSLLTRSLRKADHVFTSSISESSRILKHNPSLAEVHAVGLGLGTGLRTAVAAPVSTVQELDGFVLTVGRLNIRKNLNGVFRAISMSKKITPDFPLLVVGEADGRESTLDAATLSLIEDGTIRFLGNVSDAELRWLYEQSSLLIFGSLDEGFGLPPLEALHFGCPIAISDIPVFREIYSEAAHYFDPKDPSSIGRTIDKAIASPAAPSAPSVVAINSWNSTIAKMKNILERESSDVK